MRVKLENSVLGLLLECKRAVRQKIERGREREWKSERKHEKERKQQCRTSTTPPQFSTLKRLLKLWATKGAIRLRSWVRTRVARRDWWASLNVVSISSRPWWARTAFAKPSGPSLSSTSLKPTGGSPAACIQTHKLPINNTDIITNTTLRRTTKEKNKIFIRAIIHIQTQTHNNMHLNRHTALQQKEWSSFSRTQQLIFALGTCPNKSTQDGSKKKSEWKRGGGALL